MTIANLFRLNLKSETCDAPEVFSVPWNLFHEILRSSKVLGSWDTSSDPIKLLLPTFSFWIPCGSAHKSSVPVNYIDKV